MLDDWYKNKQREAKIRDFTNAFKKASGNNPEWQKIYREYQDSFIWAEIRDHVLARANHRCEDCGAIVVSSSMLDIHHLTYDRVGGNEKMEDLKALCSSCHLKADKNREKQTYERRQDSYYERRLDGFASKKYGPGWWYDYDRREIEIEFILFLYKKYCKEQCLDFDPDLDPDSDFDFLEFWDSVLDGTN